MRTIYQAILSTLLMIWMAAGALSQGAPGYDGGLKVKLSDDGSKYFRLVSWHQIWLEAELDGGKVNTSFTLRRSRMLMYAQLNDRFLLYTHFGVNRLNVGNMGVASPSNSNGSNGTFFMHDAWAEYSIISKKLHIGAGLHYWNGVSRLSSQSTSKSMTLDAPAFNWFFMGTSGQLARHLGMYAKGRLGKFDYRIAFNDALEDPAKGRAFLNVPGSSYYGNQPGAEFVGPQGKVVAGYFNYQFLDTEGNLTPSFVGTYLGTKKVFNVGAGFYTHFNAIGINDSEGHQIARKEDARTLGFDVFYDAPLGHRHGAVTLYGVVYHHDWGVNTYGGVGGSGSGSIFYTHAGFLLPVSNPEELRVQPYVSYAQKNLQALSEPVADINIGTNLFFYGHHSKLTIEYRWRKNPVFDNGSSLKGYANTASLLIQATVGL